MGKMWVRVVFYASGIYDSGLGLAFILFGPGIYHHFSIPMPNHPFYYEFPSLYMIVVGVLFFQIAKNPTQNRDLMLYGAALKASFVSLVVLHAVRGDMPAVWMPCGWVDTGFLLAFLVGWFVTTDGSSHTAHAERAQNAM